MNSKGNFYFISFVNFVDYVYEEIAVKMDRKSINLCAFIGLLAVMVYVCEAVPKYDTNSSKR